MLIEGHVRRTVLRGRKLCPRYVEAEELCTGGKRLGQIKQPYCRSRGYVCDAKIGLVDWD